MTVAGPDKSILFAEKLVCNGICRDDSVVVPIIKLFCRQKKALAAKDLFVKFTENLGVTSTLEMYNYLIHGLLEVHATEMGLDRSRKRLSSARTYKIVQKRNGASFQIYLSIFAKQNNSKKV